MSLAFRFGATHAPMSLFGSMALLPRLPIVADFFPRQPSFHRAGSILEELKRLLEKRDDQPFMLDNGAILKAAPKKKPSYRRTRQKLYAPGNKQIQPLENLRRCAACGRVKRSHFMCMHCFEEIRAFLKEKKKAIFGEKAPFSQNLDATDEKLIYPTRELRPEEIRMQKREWVPKREEPLMFDKKQVKK